MSILAALNSYYDRLEGIAEPGWAPQKFGYCIVLSEDGRPIRVMSLWDESGKKRRPREIIVPAVQRTSGIKPALFWDKTAYALGCTAGEARRTAEEHAAFKATNLAAIAGVDDPGLNAFRRFLETWNPDDFQPPLFSADMLDANILFRLDGDRGFLHERQAAQALVPTGEGSDEAETGLCLVTGERGPLAKLHPTIKGVDGAQSSGATLVSFNQAAFTSLGKEQGANAPTSARAAFRYGAALNRLLVRGGGNRLERTVGDATVVFWADASNAAAAAAAESFFADGLDGVTDEAEALALSRDLEAVAKGRPLSALRPNIEEGTRFHVLGLSPNASRLSVRFWLTDTLDAFARRLAEHAADLAIEPTPWRTYPSATLLLARSVALQGDFKNIPPLLAGEVMRAILAGTRYPQSWLAATIMRLRAGEPKSKDDKNASIGWHAAAIRACLARDQRLRRRNPRLPEDGETPMALKRDHENPGYQLGRLFAVYELAQRSALPELNATIRDRYFGAASSTPASVFPLIVRNGQNHLAKVRKERAGWAVLIERELEEIHGRIEPRLPSSMPRSLNLQNQGEFAIGYYHQRAAKLTDDKGTALSLAEADTIIESEEGEDQ